MKEKINQINFSIEEKRDRLKEKVERYFSAITIPSSCVQKTSQTKTHSTPPISYILYGIAGLSAFGALCTDSKVLCLGLTVASAFGGYKMSRTIDNVSSSAGLNTNLDISTLKNDIISKVLDAVKKTTNEWESFMELKQKEIQNEISLSSLPESQKDEMISKIFIYEVIDINISYFSSMIKTSVSVSDIKTQMNLYKTKFLSAIDDAASRQISKYKSIS